jgi:hypothetical protein
MQRVVKRKVMSKTIHAGCCAGAQLSKPQQGNAHYLSREYFRKNVEDIDEVEENLCAFEVADEKATGSSVPRAVMIHLDA